MKLATGVIHITFKLSFEFKIMFIVTLPAVSSLNFNLNISSYIFRHNFWISLLLKELSKQLVCVN